MPVENVDDPIRTIPEFRVKYNDIFHLKNLYVMMHEYLIDENWIGEGGGDTPSEAHSDIEKLYMERHIQKAIHRGGMELWVWWRVKKNPLQKPQGYYEYRLDIDFHGVYLKKEELMHQGKKITVDKGELEIFFRPKIVRTALAKQWANHWFLKWWQEIYEDRIIDQDLNKFEKELWREAYRLQGAVKAYLNLRNFIPVPEPFHPRLYGMEGQF
jgi:hypothetical protein